MRKKKPHKTYPLERSPLWRLQSQKELAILLGLKKASFKQMVTECEFHYKTWTGMANGKMRKFAVPVHRLRKIHEHLKRLLDRIEKPAYLYSPRTGYSSIQNAVVHSNSEQVFKIDIRQFYPSTTREHVFQFCLYRLKMSDDVAGAFAKLTTFEGRTPFGSPLSPILCFLTHKDIFDSINRICGTQGNKLSLWVDDLTISGPRVIGELIYEVKRLIETKGLGHHKEQCRHTSSGIVVTGTHVSSKVIAPANKHHLKFRDKLRQLDRTSESHDRLALVTSLLGMIDNALAIFSAGAPARERAKKRRQWLHNERRRLRKETEDKHVLASKEMLATTIDKEVPWL